MTEVKFAKLHPEAKIPSLAKAGDAGMDITAVTWTFNGEFFEYYTGLSCEIPTGYVALLFPRSSISTTNLMLCNSVGVLDSGYRGEIKARFKYLNPYLGTQDKTIYGKGDRVIQMVIMKLPEITVSEVKPEELSKTERGEGGFGSSGK